MRADKKNGLIKACMRAQIIVRATRDDGDARVGQASELMQEAEGAWQEVRLFWAWRQRRQCSVIVRANQKVPRRAK
jgi:hypothetical protein